MTIDDLFTEQHVQIDDELARNPDERPGIFRYDDGKEFRAWHTDNASCGRPHVICVAVEFLHQQPDWDILDAAFSRLSEYLNRRTDKLSNIAITEIKNEDRTWTLLFDVACNFQNENIELFIDTLSTIYGILIYMHDRHNVNDPIWFHKYQIAYIPYEEDTDDTKIYKTSSPFEELVFQLKCTIRTYENGFVNEIVSGLEGTHFFDTRTGKLWRRVISWTYKQQQRKLRIPLQCRHNDFAKEQIARAKVLSVSRFNLM